MFRNTFKRYINYLIFNILDGQGYLYSNLNYIRSALFINSDSYDIGEIVNWI